MKLTKTTPRELSGREASDLRRLSFRDRGCMATDLSYLRRAKERSDWTNYRNATVYRVFQAKKLVGWALVYEELYHRSDDEWQTIFQVYVRKSHRRKGIGRLLFRAAWEDYGYLTVLEHDKRSQLFYKQAYEMMDA